MCYVSMLQSLLSPNPNQRPQQTHYRGLIKPQPQPKTSANSLLRTPSPPHVTTVIEGLDALYFGVHSISYNMHIRDMIHVVSDAEHREQWCILDHSTTIHQHAPLNISARYTASCYPESQCVKTDKKTCSITFDQLLYFKAPGIMPGTTR